MDGKALTIIEAASKKLRDGADWWRDLTRTERILHTMRDGEWHYDTELADAGGWRFGSALHEIRHVHGIGVDCRTEPAPRKDARRRNQYRIA